MAKGERVERRDGRLWGAWHGGLEALSEFMRRGACECESEDTFRRDPSVLYEVLDPMGEHACLSSAGAGEEPGGSSYMLRGVLLFLG